MKLKYLLLLFTIQNYVDFKDTFSDLNISISLCVTCSN